MNETVGNLSRRRRLRNIFLSFLVTLVFVAILFVTAGSFEWFWAWMLVLIMLSGNTLGVVLLDPGLMEERTGVKRGYERRDLPLAIIVGRLGPLAIFIVAGLDFRFSWSGPLLETYAVLGLVLFAVGYVPTLWAMRKNRFFSAVVRIQEDRGHLVVTTGPYRFVRHPGYLGSIIFMLALPFALTSYWALIPAVATIIVTIVRTTLEDNTLKRKLKGYTEYTQRVRYRLLPGVW